jgi:hypothetical protein
MQKAVTSMKEHHLQIRCLESLLQVANSSSVSTSMENLRGALDQLARWMTEGQFVLHDYTHVSCEVDALIDAAPDVKRHTLQRIRDGGL